MKLELETTREMTLARALFALAFRFGCTSSMAAEPKWVAQLGDAGTSFAASPTDLAFHRQRGALVSIGSFSGSLDLRSASLTTSGLSPEVFVTMQTIGGSYQWSRKLELDPEAIVSANANVAVDVSGDIVVAVALRDLNPDVARGGFVAKLDADGNELWRRPLPTSLEVRDLATGPDGEIVLVGSISGADVNIGCGTMAFGGATDAFIAKLEAGGGCLSSQSAGDSDVQKLSAVVVDADH